MSIRAETQFSLVPVWLLGIVNARTYQVYGALAKYVNYESGETYVGIRTLAEDLDVSEQTISNAIRDLVRAGAVVVEDRYAEGGRRTTNLYTLLYTRREVPLESQGRVPPESSGDVPLDDEGTMNETQRDETQRDELATPSRKREPVWDWFVDRFDLTVETRTQQKRVGRLVREIRSTMSVWRGPWAKPEDEVYVWVQGVLDERARSWPSHFGDATLTPEAFVKHFDALGRPPLRGDRRTARKDELRRAVEGIE